METRTMVVNLRGANGSGKTTIAKQLLALSNDKYYALHPDTRKPYATILYDIQWVLLGVYDEDKGMGGCDGIRTMKEVHDILYEMVDTYSGYYILLEGMLISTTMTVYNYMLELEKSHNIVPMVVVLKSSVEGCLKRLEHRRGSPLERTDLVAEKCELVLKHQYKPEHVAYIDVDNIAEQDMVRRFLETVGDDLVYSYL